MAHKGETGYEPGCVLVMFKKGVTEEAARALAKSFGLEAGQWLSELRMLCVTVPFGEELQWVARFCEHESVAGAFVDAKVELL